MQEKTLERNRITGYSEIKDGLKGGIELLGIPKEKKK